MVHAVVLGGSLVGLHAALALADRHHDVTVLERDPAPPPAGDLLGWQRPGTPQLQHSHAFMARYVQLLRTERPALLEEVLAAGARLTRLPDHLPPAVGDRARREDDDDLVVLNCRRPLLESALRRHVSTCSRITVRPGVAVLGLTTAAGPVPRVTGVATTAGAVAADLVVDATGRRSRVPRWLREVGISLDEGAAAPCGNVYYTRHYRERDDPAPQTYAAGFVEPAALDSLTCVAFPGEGRTYTVSVQIEDDDAPLRVLRDQRAFDAALSVVPSFASRVDPGRTVPLSHVFVMAGLRNRLRRLVVDGRPVVAGLQLLGDALCVSNPTFGRGVAHGVWLAHTLAVLLDDHSGAELTLALDRAVDEQVLPYYRNSLARDTLTRAAWRQVLYDEEPAVDPALASHARAWLAAFTAGLADRDVWQAVTRTALMLQTPEETLAQPSVLSATATPAPASPPAPALRADLLRTALAAAG
jgi:2-polyprenyl-6-methoxyphenol hydroxylase-like FAD-dependent oxidoreductase